VGMGISIVVLRVTLVRKEKQSFVLTAEQRWTAKGEMKMRLINVDALPNIYHATHQELVLALEEAPIIEAVQVVRCKDCKYFDCWGPKGKETFDCIRFLEAPPITPEWYCADGKRREEDGD